MATFANVMNRMFMPRAESTRSTAAPTRTAERMPDPTLLRAVPAEEIYLFVKRIDNTRVVRTEDKQATASCYRTIGMACLTAVLAVGMIVPAAYNKLAGYQIERAREEQARIKKQLAQVEAAEARLLSPGELQRMADAQHFTDPAPEAMVVLNVDRTTALAMNKK